MRLLTREELAEVLKVSLRTVDAMVAAEEIPHIRMRGNLVRFYLPDVVRHLTATALTSKRRCARREDGTQVPSSKLQAPEKLQVPNFKLQGSALTRSTQGMQRTQRGNQ
jgi:excisionase family DNA binding protein